MNVPGSNILNMALRLISPSPVGYYQFVSNSTNQYGLIVSVYAVPITIYGSFQPVDKKMYAEMGLDLSKKYVNFFVSNNLIDLTRELTGDGISFQSEIFKCESAAPWFGIDGWTQMLLVKVPSLQGS